MTGVCASNPLVHCKKASPVLCCAVFSQPKSDPFLPGNVLIFADLESSCKLNGKMGKMTPTIYCILLHSAAYLLKFYLRLGGAPLIQNIEIPISPQDIGRVKESLDIIT